MSEPVDIPWPRYGLSEAQEHSAQPPLTTSDGVNVRTNCPKTQRARGALRSGRSNYVPGAANLTNKITNILSVPYDVDNIAYAGITSGSEETAWAINTETKTDCFGLALDRQQNVYALDGPSGIAKYNSEGLLQGKLSLPVADPKHVVRALLVDEFDGIFAGVSAGGDSLKAKLWKFRQLPDDTFEKLWEIETKGYVERIQRKGPLLYTIQNSPESGECYVVVYSEIDQAGTPSEAMRWNTGAYPGNDLAIGPKDGSIFTAHEPNTARGLDPRSPHTTAKQVSWTPDLLTDFGKRVWRWHAADDLDSLEIINLNGGDDPDGGEVVAWLDRSGKGRHWYAPIGTDQRGPSWKRIGIGGKPSVKFTNSAVPNVATGQWLESAVASSSDRTFRDEILTGLPSYKGAQFVWVGVLRVNVEATLRYVLGWGDSFPNVQEGRALMVNRAVGDTATTARPGQVTWFETDAAASTEAQSGSGVAPAATNGVEGHPLGQSNGPYGHIVFSVICDGGINDVFGSATRSTLRINGQPADRWQSTAFFTLAATRLGAPNDFTALTGTCNFAGEFAEDIVLSDWTNADGAIQPLITHNKHPELAWAQSNPAKELESLEGFFGGKYGLSHLFPGGPAGYLTFTATPANNDTALVNTTTYRFVTALAQINDVLIVAANPQATALNLARAINYTGQPGTDYHSATVAHTTYYASYPIEVNATPTHAIAIYARNSFRTAGSDPTTVPLGAYGTWSAATTSASLRDYISGVTPNPINVNNRNHYPHPFHLTKVTNLTLGGPPSASNAGVADKRQSLNAPYGMVVKWDPASGNVKWVATSLSSDNANGSIGIGGLGYGVAVNSAGEIYTTGPRQATSTFPSITDTGGLLFDVRKLTDQGVLYSTFTGTAITLAWQAAPASATGWTYKYGRLAVDQFDNVYVPYHDTAADSITALVYQRQPNANASGLGVLLHTINGITDDPQAHACAVATVQPVYGTDLSTTSNPIGARAEYVYIATRLEGSSITTLYKIRLVSVTPGTGSPRAKVNLAVSGAKLLKFTTGGYTSPAVGSASPFSSTAQFVDGTVLFQKAYFSDGKNLWSYDPKTDTTAALRSTTAGKIPARCRLITNWRGRLVMARDPDNPSEWYMSAYGQPTNWDYFPPVFSAGQAVKGSDSRVGLCPDIINAVYAYSSDLLFFFCNDSVHMLAGDPTSEDAQFDLVTDITGGTFGPCADKDENGSLYFMGTNGRLYVIPAGSLSVVPISEGRIPQRMLDIDFETHYVQLVWNFVDRGLHVFVCPYGAGGTHVAHYFWEKVSDTLAPWEDRFGSSTQTALQPTAAYMLDGDGQADRILLIGTEDGQILKWDPDATNDGTTIAAVTVPISGGVLFGPFAPKDSERDFLFSHLKVQLASDQGGCNYEWFSNQIPDETRHRKKFGRLEPGSNPFDLSRIRGPYVWLRLGGASTSERWAFESATCRARVGGRKRVGA